jgi:hypothetical protein
VEDFQMEVKNNLLMVLHPIKICFQEITEMIRIVLLIINLTQNIHQRLRSPLHRRSIIEMQLLEKKINIFSDRSQLNEI